MVKSLNIPFKGKEYKAIFNLNTFRLFSREMGLKKINDFTQVLAIPDGEEDVSFEQLENFAKLLLCAFREGDRQGGTKCELTLDDIFIMFEEDSSVFSNMLQSVAADEAPGEVAATDEEEHDPEKKTKG